MKMCLHTISLCCSYIRESRQRKEQQCWTRWTKSLQLQHLKVRTRNTYTWGGKGGILCVCTDCKKSHFYWMTSLFFPSVVPASGFEWGTYLENETSLAASVSCFRHVSPDCTVEIETALPLGHTFSGFLSNVFIPTGEERIVCSLARKQTEPLDCNPGGEI